MEHDHDWRRNLVLQQEGVILGSVANNGTEHTSAMARCLMDGIANAIARLDGYQEAATYAYAVGDRMVSGIKAPTDLKELVTQKSEPVPVPIATVSVHVERRPLYRQSAFWWGTLHGMLLLAILTVWRTHS